jgi:arabinofuranosyltransferase
MFVPLVPLTVLLLGTVLAYLQRWLGDPLRARHGVPSEVYFSVCWLGYWFYIGGDIYLDRFLVILLPLGIVALLRISNADVPHIGRRASVASGAILLGAIAAPLAGVEYIQWHLTGTGTDGWMLIGKHLAQRHPGSLIAVDAAGKIPYYSNLRTIDIFGLNDVHIAHLPVSGAFRLGHNKTDTEYVLGRKPDCIVTYISDDLKLTTLDLPAEEYRSRGYDVTYLASMWSGKIWNVTRRTDDEIGALVRQGFDCAIVTRRGTAATEPDEGAAE